MSNSVRQTFSRPKLSGAISAYLTEFIINNDLGPGDPLPPETRLAHELGVGRSSVREAVKALQTLGFIEVRHGDGLYVREYNFDPVVETLTYGLRWDPTTFSELLQIRVWLETAVIGDAVKQIREERVQQLDDIMETWARKVEAGQPYAEDDRRFHRVLYEPLDNTTLIKLLDVFWIAFANVGIEDITKDLDPAETLHAHQAILEAVRAGDASLARRRLVQSFSHLRKRIDEVLKEEWPSRNPARGTILGAGNSLSTEHCKE
ncbi:MAG TPA: GntR family transcriptional regulator [Chloroflexi bacterium]|nr:GntR family transcriptional regulator [Chloroflexota bacterium]